MTDGVLRLLGIAVGGAVGSVARYLLSGWVQHRTGPVFPFGTLAVNVVGSFLLGLLMHVATTTGWSPTLRLSLTTGVLGGFTTYSTFNHDTLRAFEEGAWAMGCVNLGATVVACLAAGLLGLGLGRVWVGD